MLLDGSPSHRPPGGGVRGHRPGAVGLVVDSYGLIALAARQASGRDLGIGTGDGVTLRPIVDSDDTSDDTGDGSAAESVTGSGHLRSTTDPAGPASTDVPGGAG